jgi:hypothetical protein
MDNAVSTTASIWQDDKLSRAAEAELLKIFLLSRSSERANLIGKRSYVLNVDSPWGSGKTFFLTRFRAQLEAEGYIVAYINAWQDDHADDALLPILSSIDQTISEFVTVNPTLTKLFDSVKRNGVQIATSIGKNIGKKLAKKLIGDAVDEIPDIVSGTAQSELATGVNDSANIAVDEILDNTAKAVLKKFEQSKQSIELFKSNLAKLITSIGTSNDKHAQIFVFVDELDRCRPTYAIAMLERIKHIFDTDGVIFVVATDTSQLRHSIRAVYGNEFDSSRYLLRFFDRQYHLRSASKIHVVKQLFSSGMKTDKLSVPPSIKSPEVFFRMIIEGFELSTRDVEQCFDMLKDILTVWQLQASIELAYLLPLIILHQQGRQEFDQLMKDGVSTNILDYITSHMNWSVEMSGWDNVNERHLQEKTSIWTTFDNFHTRRNLDFSQINKERNQSNAPAIKWVLDRLNMELGAEHGGRFNSNSPPKTVIKNYGSIVRSISNFSD